MKRELFLQEPSFTVGNIGTVNAARPLGYRHTYRCRPKHAFVYVVQGQMTNRIGEILLIVEAGELTFFPAGTQYSSVYSAEGFKELTREVTSVVCRLAEDILDGKAEADPAAWKNNRTACDYCPYSSVCGFDLSIEGYKYRK